MSNKCLYVRLVIGFLYDFFHEFIGLRVFKCLFKAFLEGPVLVWGSAQIKIDNKIDLTHNIDNK